MEGIPHPIQFLSGDEPQDQLRMSIVTKKGDGGQTALRMGRKTSKAAWRVEAYGTVDELSAALGVARSFLSQDARFGDFASRILTVQNQLLSVGADLATRPEDAQAPGGGIKHFYEDSFLTWLEDQVPGLESGLRMDRFVLPGENPASAHLHYARTVCRRAERGVIRLREEGGEPIVPDMLPYLNRLSDYLWLMAEKCALATAGAGS